MQDAIEEFEAHRYAKTWLTKFVPVILLFAGILEVILSIRVGIGTPKQPGPGLWPLVAAIVMVLASLLVYFTDEARDYEMWTKRSFLIVVGICILALYIPLILTLGFLTSSILLMIVWLKFFSGEKWWTTIIIGIGSAIFFILFSFFYSESHYRVDSGRGRQR